MKSKEVVIKVPFVGGSSWQVAESKRDGRVVIFRF